MSKKQTAAATAARRAKAAGRRRDEIKDVMEELRPEMEEALFRKLVPWIAQKVEAKFEGGVKGRVERMVADELEQRESMGAVHEVHQDKFWNMATNAAKRVVAKRVPSLVGEHGDTPHDEDCWQSFKEVVEKVVADSPALKRRLLEASRGCAPFLEVKDMPAGTRGALHAAADDMGRHTWITRSAHNPGDEVRVEREYTTTILTEARYREIWGLGRFPQLLGHIKSPRDWRRAVREWINSVYPDDDEKGRSRVRKINTLQWAAARLREAAREADAEIDLMNRESRGD